MTKIATLIEAAEARAVCKLGMAATRSRFLVRLAPEDATALAVYGGHLSLSVNARRGTVDLVYAAADGTADGGYREISKEPSEPELQALAVTHARRNPVGAALELLRLDLERRAEQEDTRVSDLTTRLRVRDAELNAEKASRDAAGYDPFRHA